MAGDVADPAVGQGLVDAAIERFDRLDVLVTNAGSIQVGPVGAMRAENFANAMDLMFYGVLHPCWPRSRCGSGLRADPGDHVDRWSCQRLTCCPTSRPSMRPSGSPRGCGSRRSSTGSR